MGFNSEMAKHGHDIFLPLISISILFLNTEDSKTVKESACNAGDPGSIPGLGRSPREGNRNPFQYSCLENSMDRGAWWVTDHEVPKSGTGLSD